MISGTNVVSPVTGRMRGVEQAFASIGLKPDPARIRLGSFSTTFAWQAASELLDGTRPPTAFFVAGTAVLPGLLRTLQERGLSVPRDISVVAGAETELAEFHARPISVVSRNHGALGAVAARFLRAHIEQPARPPQHALGPSDYVPRGSYASPSKDHRP